MKIAVIYKSTYGSTEQYAKWLSKELSADLIENVGLHLNELAAYDTIIYGAGVYAGSINGIKIIADNMKMLAGKRIVLFTVGTMDPSSGEAEEAFSGSLHAAFTDDQLEKIKVFHLRGDLDYSKLTPLHRAMMFGLKTFLSTKKNPSQSQRMILESYGKASHFTNKGSITPIVEHCKCE